jgi:hypothetical protein
MAARELELSSGLLEGNDGRMVVGKPSGDGDDEAVVVVASSPTLSPIWANSWIARALPTPCARWLTKSSNEIAPSWNLLRSSLRNWASTADAAMLASATLVVAVTRGSEGMRMSCGCEM